MPYTQAQEKETPQLLGPDGSQLSEVFETFGDLEPFKLEGSRSGGASDEEKCPRVHNYSNTLGIQLIVATTCAR